jgi:nucleotide-binding universal stress UspA family protein
VAPHQTRLGIVVGVDGSPSSISAVEWAARDADMRNVPIKLVHIVAPIVTAAEGWSDIPAPSDLTRWQEDHARQIIEEAHKLAVEASSPSRASQVTSEVLYAPIVPTLVDLSKRADMVVVGCRGEGVPS